MKQFVLIPERLASIKLIVSILFVAVCVAAGSFAWRPSQLEAAALSAAQTPTPAPAFPTPSPVINNSQVPADVSLPAGFSGNGVAYFDDYSWRAFIAEVWPAQSGQRGVPDTTKSVGDAGPRVFETYKALSEVFHNDGSAPPDWNVYDQANACSQAVGFGDMVLASYSKFGDIGQAGVGTLVGPIIAQNDTFIKYLTSYDETAFDQIQTNQWYLRSKLGNSTNPLTFNDGSIDIKSSWMDMTGVAHPERYYTRTATVMDPYTGVCTQKTVGLVGIHIVQKTPTRPQWIWSTFEQIDNVPPPAAGAPGNFNLNDGTGTAMPGANPIPLNPLPSPMPTPFNVTRVQPITSSTQGTNALYQQALQGTVWQYYKLVMTQWPTPGNAPTNPGTPGFTIPGTAIPNTQNIAFSNMTMETFDQLKIQQGCMNCHNSTKFPSDFVWSLADHAYPQKVPNLLMKDPAVRAMRNIMMITPNLTKTALAKPVKVPAKKAPAKKAPAKKKSGK
jgi:hypothetical protein